MARELLLHALGFPLDQSSRSDRGLKHAAWFLSDSASGGAYDWAKAVAGIKYTYTYELRPDSNAYNGFVVSENEIEPSGEEVWASLVATVDTIKAM